MKIFHVALLLFIVYICEANIPEISKDRYDYINGRLIKSKEGRKSDSSSKYQTVTCTDAESCMNLLRNLSANKINVSIVIPKPQKTEIQQALDNLKDGYLRVTKHINSLLQIVPTIIIDKAMFLIKGFFKVVDKIFQLVDRKLNFVLQTAKGVLWFLRPGVNMLKSIFTVIRNFLPNLNAQVEEGGNYLIYIIKKIIFKIFLVPVKVVVWLYELAKNLWDWIDDLFFAAIKATNTINDLHNNEYNLEYYWAMSNYIIVLIVCSTIAGIFFLTIAFVEFILVVLASSKLL